MQVIIITLEEVKEQPQAITIEQLYGMIDNKRHEVITLHMAYKNAITHCEQQALQQRINVAAKELNHLMTIAQCH